MLILSLRGQAYGDFLEEFSVTRTLAYETLRVVHGISPLAERKALPRNCQLRNPRDGKKMTRREIDNLIEKKAARHGINPDFVRSVVKVESGYNVSALSPKGAMGLMQLMPGTASDLWVENPWDPAENLEGGISYLASLLSEFRDVRHALVAYNAGPEVIKKKQAVPQETRQYVHLVLTHFNGSHQKHKEIRKRRT
jgi:hypothetical protein